MKRRALIIFCDNTQSGELHGTVQDYHNYYNFLTSSLGGHWYNKEIEYLRNPTVDEVIDTVTRFSSLNLDYVFTIFSGHGFINTQDNLQYIELKNGYLKSALLLTSATRQTIIVDACRNLLDYSQTLSGILKEEDLPFIGDVTPSTRALFDSFLSQTEEGWVMVYSANIGESSYDTTNGGVYLYSLLLSALFWRDNDSKHNILPINITHQDAKNIVEAYNQNQHPSIINNIDNRLYFFPFAVKHTSNHNL